jgi:hypothetical protein
MLIPIRIEHEEKLIGIDVDILLREIRIHYSDLTTETRRFTKQEFDENTIQLQFI